MPLARRTVGVSEVFGAVLALAITLVVGAATFGFVSTQATVSERQYGNAVQANVESLQERFVLAQVSYASNSVTLYVYNNGQIADNFVHVEVYNTTSSKIDLLYDANFVTDLNHPGTCKVAATTSLVSPLLGTSPSCFSVTTGSVSSIKLTLPSCYTGAFKAGFTYYFRVLGQYGNSVTYFQGM
jgi:hypothetical protein